MEDLMWFFAKVSLLIGLACSVSAKEIDHHELLLRVEEQRSLPACEDLTEQRELCELLREGRRRVQNIPLSIIKYKQTVARGTKLVQQETVLREFVLAAYDKEAREWHDILLAMPLVGNSTFQPVVLTEHDSPYQVTRLRGQTFIKMIFEVEMSGRKLQVYAGKHLSTPSVFQNTRPEKMQEETEVVTYLAASPYIANPAFAALGKVYVEAALREALIDLREKKVPSKAYPGKLVADVISPEVLMNLLVLEQTDACLLQVHEPGCDKLSPKQLYQNNEQVVDAVLTEFVINGLDAYRYICSGESAYGAFQFTNTPWLVERIKNGKKVKERIGTYDIVREDYPEAMIDPNFRRGTKSFHNSAKAAALLLDLELSSKRIPDWVRVLFVEDYRSGTLILNMAYNGGESQSRSIAELFIEYRKTKGIDRIVFDSFPWQSFLAWVEEKNLAVRKGQKLVLKWETLGYLKKGVMWFQRQHPSMKQL